MLGYPPPRCSHFPRLFRRYCRLPVRLMRHRFLPLLLPLLLLCSLNALAAESEELEYDLSYSGLITGFIWKKLADVTLDLQPEEVPFIDRPSQRISMFVTTANYSFAETFHALRYRWESILNPELDRTLLVRIVDKGDNDSHEVAWYDWEKKAIDLFRKRKQIDKAIPFFNDGPILVWEKDKFEPAPAFIDPFEPVAPGLGYLMHTKHRAKRLKVDAIDPLTMLLRLQRHDFIAEKRLPMQILLDDELAPYEARFIAREELARGDCVNQARKIEVKRSNEAGERGYMHLWLSDDAQQTILRLDVEAPLGQLHVELKPSQTVSGQDDCHPRKKEGYFSY